jgi:radical SAM/Cys-rich protein
LELLSMSRSIHTVDLTGGAPELNPSFRDLVIEIRKMGKKVIDRCNLTVFFEEGQEDTPLFLREHKVQIIASLPCYTKGNVEKQRGNGVFDKSIRAIKTLNQLGYSKSGTGLELNLVYNPLGAYLPSAQEKLEQDYKAELKKNFDIEFDRLYTITNMPIKRFLHDLERQGKLDDYMELLLNSFNPRAVESVMCRNLVSVSWDGYFFDCDFNQMLEIPINRKKTSLWDLTALEEFSGDPIAVANHCYGCTAGAGSSCGGVLVK